MLEVSTPIRRITTGAVAALAVAAGTVLVAPAASAAVPSAVPVSVSAAAPATATWTATRHLVFTAPSHLPRSGVFADLGDVLVNGVHPAGLGLGGDRTADVRPYLHVGVNTVSIPVSTRSGYHSLFSADLVIGDSLRSIRVAEVDATDLLINGRRVTGSSSTDLRHVDIAAYLVPGANGLDVPATITPTT